ncbi:acyl carrier protein [Kitasatospora sp. NPDC091207]|uniref:acyl carrier protein n=1 Tax=Kitasatospora sp. NPDC091207 TaxID=3364083 RepID=UPI003809E22D
MSVDTTSAAGGGLPTAAAAPDSPHTLDSAHSAHSPHAPHSADAVTDSLVAVFRRVLETPEVAADSDFFRLGGDSLIATRVLSAIARGHGVELSFDDFLLAPTPRALAAKIAAGR